MLNKRRDADIICITHLLRLNGEFILPIDPVKLNSKSIFFKLMK